MQTKVNDLPYSSDIVFIVFNVIYWHYIREP